MTSGTERSLLIESNKHQAHELYLKALEQTFSPNHFVLRSILIKIHFVSLFFFLPSHFRLHHTRPLHIQSYAPPQYNTFCMPSGSRVSASECACIIYAEVKLGLFLCFSSTAHPVRRQIRNRTTKRTVSFRLVCEKKYWSGQLHSVSQCFTAACRVGKKENKTKNTLVRIIEPLCNCSAAYRWVRYDWRGACGCFCVCLSAEKKGERKKQHKKAELPFPSSDWPKCQTSAPGLRENPTSGSRFRLLGGLGPECPEWSLALLHFAAF